MPTDPPTVASLCETFLPLATRYAIPWAERYPHLAAEFKSRAGYDLFTAARGYVARGEQMWERMPFLVWLKICVTRGCQKVVAREHTRHPIGFVPQMAGDELSTAPGRTRSPDVDLGDDEQRHADLEHVVGLLDVLDADEVELVLRHLIDGETVAALAREAERPHSTVHTRITRAVHRLRLAAGTETKK